MYTNTDRDPYDAILIHKLPANIQANVNLLVEAAATAPHTKGDAWAFGAEFDRKRRGAAINWSLYGIGTDVHSGNVLIVVQVRLFQRRYAHGFADIRKNYFLIGRNEDGAVFAHPVEAQVVRSAIRRDVDVVKAAQDWLWGADYAGVVRQGDFALIPQKRAPAASVAYGPHVLAGSHAVLADQVRIHEDKFYALNPTLLHLKGTHAVAAHEGWCRIVQAQEAATWSFARPTID